ncbi:MAG TPA: alpha/beta hydrolase-fold protein [Candidatus Elarobacter sp.]|nr:alpha/beta hydrolase-fold protein [Candidatus Elarobacter sp.]
MRRRAVLRALASCALAAGGLSGCDAVRERLTLVAERGHGCVDVPVPAAAGVHVERAAFESEHVRGPVGYALVVPDDVRVDAFAYVLPGRGSTAAAAGVLRFDAFLAELLRRGARPFGLAIVDAGESYFHPRASGEDRLAMVTEELPRVVRDAIGRPVKREAIVGQSMGGYGALLAAERAPGRYRAVAVAGPAIFPSYADESRSVGDAFDSAADYAAHDVVAHAGALRGRPVMIAVGRRDPFLPGVRMFARACPTARVVERPGCHDDGFWRASAASLLSFVAGHL